MSQWITQRYRCTRCGFDAYADDWEIECVFAGSLEEPPEYEAFCPGCGESWEEAIEVENP
ncbi:MAG: hypothetical protein GWN89_08920 [Thermoplasmata archaeon]|nr:hypothetical protein [Thermoplasmata archaeon]NIS20040.1 hypothetical protein [Thermoplasmata archaeon]NIT77240.1 hypothetical protein [Thermoplasmata archaeon]NIY03611.1 hypothetical protein [Thermoplasmata archaeon]